MYRKMSCNHGTWSSQRSHPRSEQTILIKLVLSVVGIIWLITFHVIFVYHYCFGLLMHVLDILHSAALLSVFLWVIYRDGYKPWPWISGSVSVVHLSYHQAGTTCQLPFLIPSIKRRAGWYQHTPHLIELYGQTPITGRTLLSRVG